MSDKPEAFFDLYARGDALADDIDDHVDRWHEEMAEQADHPSLGSYLGMTDDEYRVWAKDGTALPRILIARRTGMRIDDYLLQDHQDLRLAARGDPAALATVAAILRRRLEG